MTFGREATNLSAGKRTEEPLMRRVFLDHQSTTPVLPEVFDAMKRYFLETFGSASSLHRLGLHSRDALARARAQVASLINAESPDDILFTSGGTESANLAVKGTAYANQRRGNHIVISKIEHPAVIHSAQLWAKERIRSAHSAESITAWSKI